MIQAPADPTLMLVAADHRLDGLAVFAHAKPLVMLVMALLLVATVASAALWARGLFGARRAPDLAVLEGVSAAGPLLGLFGAAYGLMDACIGLANVRPLPSLSILAPGLAEAFLSISLGLLAAAIATVARHHLKMQPSKAVASDPNPGRAQAEPLARDALPA